MSRRARGGGAVRGPASALTSFLAGLGVEPSTRLTTWGNSSAIPTDNANQGDQLAHDGPVLGVDEELDPAGAVTARTVEAGPSLVGEGTPEDSDVGSRPRDEDDEGTTRKRSKTKRSASVDSNDLDQETPATISGPSTPSVAIKPGPLKAAGQFMVCGECTKKFTVTAYTKEHPSQPSTWLCVPCCYTLGINPFEKTKKPTKKTGGKDDRAKIVHYEERKGVAGLSDVCIQIIGKYIEDVERLGDIGTVNLDKVCRIISKGRKLTPETASLLYSSDRVDLSMYDCTRLVHDSYVTMANLCPNIERLHLQLCGQLMADTLKHWGKTLKQLRRVELYAPFLVRKDGWESFITACGERLEGFLVTQSPRIDLETIGCLVESCPNLTELRLSEIGLLDGTCLEAISKLKKLKLLDLSAPPHSLQDDDVISLVTAIGSTLENINLSANAELTDATLLAIARNCPKLQELHMRHQVEFTNEGVAQFFNELSSRGHPGLTVIDLEKGHDLQDEALAALLAQSGKSVQRLSILGWKDTTADALGGVAQCSALRSLDLGWCRKLTDFALKDIIDGCQAVQTVRVWGCNQLTDRVPRKRGVKVIGIESHSI